MDKENIYKGVDILKRIMRYRRGEGKYNFSRGLSDQEREIASMEAWEEIEHEILSYLSSIEQNVQASVATDDDSSTSADKQKLEADD